MAIPYIREIEFEYGVVEQVSPLIRRVIANNPGPFTYVGTGVYIIGHGEVAVIDPGPENADHFEALKKALEGETVTHVLVTHGHSDHSPLATPLAEWAGCKTYAKNCGVPTAKGELGSADDLGFMPDVKVGDGDVISGPGWTLDVIETPGHTCNHLCFGLREENACLSGDHIMGWSTTVVAPPDGDMGDYMRSLDKIQADGIRHPLADAWKPRSRQGICRPLYHRIRQSPPRAGGSHIGSDALGADLNPRNGESDVCRRRQTAISGSRHVGAWPHD